MNSNDCETVEEYNIRADVALDLFGRGLLLSEAPEPFRKNKGLSEENYLEIGLLRLSPRARHVVNSGYWSHVSKVLFIWLITSGSVFTILATIFL